MTQTPKDYSKLTDDQFDAMLSRLVNDMSGGEILAIPGVYKLLSEKLNNDVLDQWAYENPALVYPKDRETG